MSTLKRVKNPTHNDKQTVAMTLSFLGKYFLAPWVGWKIGSWFFYGGPASDMRLFISITGGFIIFIVIASIFAGISAIMRNKTEYESSYRYE